MLIGRVGTAHQQQAATIVPQSEHPIYANQPVGALAQRLRSS